MLNRPQLNMCLLLLHIPFLQPRSASALARKELQILHMVRLVLKLVESASLGTASEYYPSIVHLVRIGPFQRVLDTESGHDLCTIGNIGKISVNVSGRQVRFRQYGQNNRQAG